MLLQQPVHKSVLPPQGKDAAHENLRANVLKNLVARRERAQINQKENHIILN